MLVTHMQTKKNQKIVITGYNIDAVGMILVTNNISKNMVTKYNWKNMAISFLPTAVYFVFTW